MLALARTNQDNIQLAFSLEQAAQWLRDNPDLPTMTALVNFYTFGSAARGQLERFAGSLDGHVVEHVDEHEVRISSDCFGYRLRVSGSATAKRVPVHYESILRSTEVQP